MKRFDPNKTWRGHYVPPYHDPERVPMILLALALMVVLVVFLVWAVR